MKSRRQKKPSRPETHKTPEHRVHRGLCLVSRGGLEPAFVEPGDSAQGFVLLLAIASVAHGLQVGDVVVRFTVAGWHDVVYCPVSTVEVFAT